jgi:Transcriptional regulators
MRPIVGLLTASTVEPWAARQWQGVVEAARELDVELISYIGGVLRSPRYDEQANVMYELAAAARLDGLIVWSTAIGWLISKPEMATFLARFKDVPMVSMEMRFPGIPSVLMDDYGGMRSVIDHLIEDHGRRRIAFLRGPSTHEGFEERYRAYLDSVAAHSLPLDPRLVGQVVDSVEGGEALAAMLDAAPSLPDALVGADDNLVLSASNELKARGIRIPEDIALAGFDNLPECLAVSPTLSSAAPPFFAMGRRALEIVVDRIEGRAVPESELLPVSMARRRSCGCSGHDSPRSPADRDAVSDVLPALGLEALPSGACAAVSPFVDEGWDAVSSALPDTLSEGGRELCRALWKLFAAESLGCEGASNSFFPSFERELNRAQGTGADASAWLRIFTAAQSGAASWAAGLPLEARLRAARLRDRAQALLAEEIGRQIARRQVSLSERNALVRELGERLGVAQDLDAQMEIVSRYLARLGIPGCCISLFSDPADPSGEARLVLAFHGGRRLALPDDGLVFRAPDLIPDAIAAEIPGFSRLALSLFFGREASGFVVFDIESKEDAPLCETLRWQISWALKSAAVIREEKAAAAAKATMLKELQHRVKNSMSLIAAIAGIEADGAALPETKEALASLQARIVAVGDLYEVLYDSGGMDEVDLADYLGRVVDTTAESLGGGAGRVAFDRSLERCAMDLKRAVSLGLIVNELITDSLKHAFPEGRAGRIGVRLSREGSDLVLEVRDDGIGFPSGFEPELAEGFGLQMIYLLARQLDGSVVFEAGNPGTKTTLRLAAN